MNFSTALFRLFKVLLLTGVIFALFATVYPLVGVGQDLPEVPADQGQAALILLGCCFLQATMLSLFILRSRWTGWRLIMAVFTIMSLTAAILSQMDSLWFLPQMSRVLIGKLILATGIQAALFSFIAVWVLGRGRLDTTQTPLVNPIHRSPRSWVLTFLALAVLHVILYFTCGYYIAWKSPELVQFYGGNDPGSFYLQLLSIVRGDPFLFPFQILRGLIWGLVVVLLAGSLRGSRLSAALISTFVLISLFSILLLIPNPLMPEGVRLAHLVETVVSRGLFGFIAVWFLRSSAQLPSDQTNFA